MIRQPASCPHCGSSAATSDGRGARCGAERIPLLPKQHRERSIPAVVVVGWVLLVLLCRVPLVARFVGVRCVLALMSHPRTLRLIPAVPLALTVLALGGLSGAQCYVLHQTAGGATSAFTKGSRKAPAGPATVAWVSSRYDAALRRLASGVAVATRSRRGATPPCASWAARRG
jgi:hypothetical protein